MAMAAIERSASSDERPTISNAQKEQFMEAAKTAIIGAARWLPSTVSDGMLVAGLRGVLHQSPVGTMGATTPPTFRYRPCQCPRRRPGWFDRHHHRDQCRGVRWHQRIQGRVNAVRQCQRKRLRGPLVATGCRDSGGDQRLRRAVLRSGDGGLPDPVPQCGYGGLQPNGGRCDRQRVGTERVCGWILSARC